MTNKQFIRTALLVALATVLTMYPQFKTPTGGYVHFGDSVIYLAAIFMGPISGAIVGAIGHSLADILSGASIYAVPTFIIKGLMGYVIGKIVYNKIDTKHFVLGGIAALFIVTLGYFIAEIPLLGLKAAFWVFISSPVQWLMSIVASAILIPAFTQVFKRLN